MPIVQISLANTFFEWLGTTVNLVYYANLLETGNYEKSSNTFFINSPGTGFVCNSAAAFNNPTNFNNPGTSISVTNDGQFLSNVHVSKLINLPGFVISNTGISTNNFTLSVSTNTVFVSNTLNANANTLNITTKGDSRFLSNTIVVNSNTTTSNANTLNIRAITANVLSNNSILTSNAITSTANATSILTLGTANIDSVTLNIDSNLTGITSNTTNVISNTVSVLGNTIALTANTTRITSNDYTAFSNNFTSTANVTNILTLGTANIDSVTLDIDNNVTNIDSNTFNITTSGISTILSNNTVVVSNNFTSNANTTNIRSIRDTNILSNNTVVVSNNFTSTSNDSIVISNRIAITGNTSNLISNSVNIRSANFGIVSNTVNSVSNTTIVNSTGNTSVISNNVYISTNNIVDIESNIITLGYNNYDRITIDSQGTTIANSSFIQNGNAAILNVVALTTPNTTVVTNLNSDYLDGSHGSYYSNLSNTAHEKANTAFSRANTAYAHANGAFLQANNAYNTGNSAWESANAAHQKANAAYNTANNAWDGANASYTYASSTANNAYITANNAWDGANASYTYASSTANNAYITANNAWAGANNSYRFASNTANNAYITANNAWNTANIANINAANASYLTNGTVPNERLVSVPNSSLANNIIKFGSTTVALGSNSNIITGLSSLESTVGIFGAFTATDVTISGSVIYNNRSIKLSNNVPTWNSSIYYTKSGINVNRTFDLYANNQTNQTYANNFVDAELGWSESDKRWVVVDVVSSNANTETIVWDSIGLNKDNLSFFSTTTSSELASIISDETGSGNLVFSNSPTLVNPILSYSSPTIVANLSSDLLDGQSGEYFTNLTNTANTWLQANDAITLASAKANDYSTLVASYANDSVTLASARANDHSTLVASYANDSVTLASARANDHSTLVASYANDAITLASARAYTDAANSYLISNKYDKTGGTISGNVIITGDLSINGTTTTINSTTLSVDDKEIELGSVDSPTNTTADGGGIRLKAGVFGDKLLNWISSSNSWTSSVDFNLSPSGSSYRIGGTSVLSTSVLGSSVTTSSLTSVGTLTSVTTSGQIVSTDVWDATTGGGNISLNSSTGNRIDWNTNGVNPPSTTTRSTGTKLVLYPSVSASAVDYAIGIENSTLWNSVPLSSNAFKWYANTTAVMTLSGTGVLTADGSGLTNLNATNLSSGTIPGDRGVSAGSTSASFVEYNGTTKTIGQFDGGSTAPTNTTRLNYDGNLYATTFYGAGTGLSGTASSLTAGAVTNGVYTSRSLTITNGTGITGGSAQNLAADRSWTIGLTGQALAFHNLASNGLVTRTAADTIAARSIAASTGISVTNGDGVAGNPTITNTGVTSITGTASQITASASTGAVTLSLPQNITTTATPTFGALNISSTSPTINMVDTDNVTRYLHTNSNIIGFLTSASAWAFQCDNSGNVTATGNVTAYSDENLKENIETIPNALDSVKQMRGVNFVKKDTKEAGTGVIAQEIQKIVPEVVLEDATGTLSVAYGNLVGYLIEAIKDQQKQIDELKSKIGN